MRYFINLQQSADPVACRDMLAAAGSLEECGSGNTCHAFIWDGADSVTALNILGSDLQSIHPCDTEGYLDGAQDTSVDAGLWGLDSLDGTPGQGRYPTITLRKTRLV